MTPDDQSKQEESKRASEQPSYQCLFLLPVFEVRVWPLFPGPPCVTSLLPVQTLGQNNTAVAQEETRKIDTHTLFSDENVLGEELILFHSRLKRCAATEHTKKKHTTK